jgi:hypothetical protein
MSTTGRPWVDAAGSGALLLTARAPAAALATAQQQGTSWLSDGCTAQRPPSEDSSSSCDTNRRCDSQPARGPISEEVPTQAARRPAAAPPLPRPPSASRPRAAAAGRPLSAHQRTCGATARATPCKPPAATAAPVGSAVAGCAASLMSSSFDEAGGRQSFLDALQEWQSGRPAAGPRGAGQSSPLAQAGLRVQPQGPPCEPAPAAEAATSAVTNTQTTGGAPGAMALPPLAVRGRASAGSVGGSVGGAASSYLYSIASARLAAGGRRGCGGGTSAPAFAGGGGWEEGRQHRAPLCEALPCTETDPAAIPLETDPAARLENSKEGWPVHDSWSSCDQGTVVGWLDRGGGTVLEGALGGDSDGEAEGDMEPMAGQDGFDAFLRQAQHAATVAAVAAAEVPAGERRGSRGGGAQGRDVAYLERLEEVMAQLEAEEGPGM